MKKASKRKVSPGQCVCLVLYALMGIICGIIIVAEEPASGSKGLDFILQLVIGTVLMYIAFFLQIIVHEAGHLIFGLLSGYRFVSFRIADFMIINDGGRLRLGKFSLAGTGGQCLMSPPDVPDEELPYFWYNFGGALLNLIVSAALALIYFCCYCGTYLSMFLLLMLTSGICASLTNGIPMRVGLVDNDGYNAISLGKSPEALRSFAVQLKGNEMQTRGMRTKDMPEDWFILPDDESMQNSMTAVTAVLCENRLMDEHRFYEAKALTERLLSGKSAITGMHRGLLICDLIYCKVLAGEDISKHKNEQQLKFMKQMKKFPSVIRTEYAIAIADGADDEKLSAIRQRFDKCITNYPYKADAQTELELIEELDKNNHTDQ